MHPAVAEVGGAGVPDVVKGEVAKAWVVLRPGTSTTAGNVRTHCREHLAPYKVPATVECCHALPKTLLVSKVMRHKLGAAQDTLPEGSTAELREHPSA